MTRALSASRTGMAMKPRRRRNSVMTLRTSTWSLTTRTFLAPTQRRPRRGRRWRAPRSPRLSGSLSIAPSEADDVVSIRGQSAGDVARIHHQGREIGHALVVHAGVIGRDHDTVGGGQPLVVEGNRNPASARALQPRHVRIVILHQPLAALQLVDDVEGRGFARVVDVALVAHA